MTGKKNGIRRRSGAAHGTPAWPRPAATTGDPSHRRLLDSVKIPVLALDRGLMITYCNRAYARFVGKAAGKLTGRALLAVFPRLKNTKTVAAYRAALRTGKPQTVTGRMGDRYLSARVFRTPDGLLALADDVTERTQLEQELARVRRELEIKAEKRAVSLDRSAQALQREIAQRERTERELRDSEHKYRAILENSQDIITILNDDGAVRYANAALTTVLGHPVGEVLGKRVFDFIHPSDAPRAIRLLSELQQRPGAALTVELRLRHADGNWRMLEATGKSIPQTQLLGGIVVNARDVTEGCQARDEARESEQRQRVLFDLAPEAYFLCDLKGQLADCNRAFEQMAGVSREALAGKSLWDLKLIPIEQAPELTALLARNALGFEAGPGEFRLRTADGREFDAEIRTHPVKIKRQPLVLGMVADVTEARGEREREQGYYRGLEFLARTAGALVRLGSSSDLPAYIVDRLSELMNGAIVGVMLFDPETGRGRTRAVAGIGAIRGAVEKLLGFDLLDQTHGDLAAEIRAEMSSARLVRQKDGIFELFFRAVPRPVCRAAEAQFRVTAVHAMGMVSNDKLLGAVSIVLREGQELAAPAIVETFINQAALALERRRDEEQLRRDIEERDRSAEALRRSEEFSRAVIDHSPLGISVRSAAGELLTCNAAWKRLWGLSDEALIREIVGRRPELVGERDGSLLAGWLPAVQRVYREGGALHIPELLVRGEDGPERWLALHFSALKGGGDAVDRVIIVAEDISERRRSQEQVKRSEQHFRALIERSSEVITILDREGVIRYKSPAVERELGYRPDELAGKPVFDFIHPEDAADLLKLFGEALATPGSTGTAEFRFRHREGSWVSLAATGQNLLHDPAVGGVVINSRNITGRKQAAEALRESEQQYRGVFDNAAEGIYRTTPDGRVLLANPALVRMLGYDSLERLLQRDIDAEGYLDPGTRKTFKERIERDGAVRDFVNSWRRQDGTELVVRENARAVRAADGSTQYYEGTVEDITARMAAMRAMQESEERYRALVETMSDGLVMTDNEGVILFANDRLCRMLGYGKDELRGRVGIEALITPEDRELVREKSRQRLAGAAERHRVRMSRKDGTAIWVGISATPFCGADGAAAGAISVISDVEMEQRAKQALAESEQRYRALAEASPDMIFVVGPDGEVQYANEACGRAFGRGAAGLTGQRVSELFTGETARRQGENMGRVFRTGEPLFIEGESVFPGGPRWLETWLVPLKDAAGAVTAVQGVSRDVTDRKNAARALEQSEGKYRTLFDQASDGIMFMPVDGSEIMVNQSFARMHGYDSPAEMAGVKLDDLDTPETAALAPERLRRLAEGEAMSFEVEHRHKQGHAFPLQVSCSTVEIGGRKYFLGFHRDISERRRAEEALRELNRRIEYVLGATRTGFDIIDSEFNVVYIDPEWKKTYGEPAGRKCHEYFMGRRQVCPNCGIVTALREKKATVTEEFLEREQRWVEVHTIPFQNPAGQWLVAEFNIDINARKNADAVLRESERRYRSLIDNMSDGVYRTSGGGKFLDANPAMARMFGYDSREELLQADIPRDLYFSEDDRLTTYPEDGSDRRRALRMKRRDGSEIWVEDSCRYVKGGDGRVEVHEGVLRDITERRRAEESLRESEERYRTALESMTDAVHVVDRDLRIVLVNSAFAAWMDQFGLAGDIAGKTVFEAFPFLPPGVRDEYRRVLDQAVTVATEETTELAGRAVVTATRKIPVEIDGRVERVLTVIRDVTERRAAEERIRFLTFHDRLTGLFNRACFEERAREFDAPGHLPLSLIMGDANGLKLVNDAFGHEAGDRFLQRIAAIITSCVRPGDLVFRWGGDEFVVLMPGAAPDAAREVCDAVRRACAAAAEDPIRPSIALGAGTKTDPAQRLSQVMMEAEDRMYRHKLVESRSLRSSIVSSLGRTLWEADYETEEHALRLQELAGEFGRALNLSDSEMNDLQMLAALHDIGKIAIADNILLKPAMLSEDEWEIVRKHPEIGFRIAQASPELAPIAEGILSHHERWDGAGYPQGLQAEKIPLLARILAIIDAYDVMTQKRLYKTVVSSKEAVAELRRCAGTQFDPRLVDLFIKIISRK